jgi:hypothetical protein
MTRLALNLAAAAAVALASGCGGDNGNGNGEDLPNPGFLKPAQVTTAYEEVSSGVWEAIGPADWSCLGSASDDEAATADRNLTGQARDFQSNGRLVNATVTVYDDTNFSGQGLESSVSDEDGEYELTLPAGGVRWAFKVEHNNALDTYTLNQYFPPEDTEPRENINSVSLLTAEALPAFIGVTRTQGLGILAGAIRDCNDDEVFGAIATVSSVSGQAEHLDGAETYYFSAASTSLPVRHSVVHHTNFDGLFVVIELPVAPAAFLQVWGYPTQQHLDDDDLVLLAEISAPIFADSVVTASLEPLRDL